MNVFSVGTLYTVCMLLLSHNKRFVDLDFQPLLSLDVDHGTTRPGIKLPLTLSFDYPSVQVQSEKI